MNPYPQTEVTPWRLVCQSCDKEGHAISPLYFGGGREIPPRLLICPHCGFDNAEDYHKELN